MLVGLRARVIACARVDDVRDGDSSEWNADLCSGKESRESDDVADRDHLGRGTLIDRTFPPFGTAGPRAGRVAGVGRPNLSDPQAQGKSRRASGRPSRVDRDP